MRKIIVRIELMEPESNSISDTTLQLDSENREPSGGRCQDGSMYCNSVSHVSHAHIHCSVSDYVFEGIEAGL